VNYNLPHFLGSRNGTQFPNDNPMIREYQLCEETLLKSVLDIFGINVVVMICR
jgi:hypothetical protein